MAKKILFLIHDLREGGAEKVLVNLVNNMNHDEFDITVKTLFDVGVNRQFLSPDIHYCACFNKMIPGNSKLMKLLTPEQLHSHLIQEHYDIEVSYLEGPSARIISGCNDRRTKTVCWIHIAQKTKERFASSFRNYQEAVWSYNQFDQIVTVSKAVKKDFLSLFQCNVPVCVLYNTNESDKIRELSREPITDTRFDLEKKDEIRLIGVGKLLKNKGFDRLERILYRLLNEHYNVHVYVLGIGPEKQKLERYAKQHHIKDRFTLLGYKINPYKYVANCNLFVCASYAEGFSTAATEAMIVGTPVCTTDVSGMRELLGENNEYGVITNNDELSLYQGIKMLLDRPKQLQLYQVQAQKRSKIFSTSETVHRCEEMLTNLN